MTAFLIKHYWHTPGMGSMNANKAPKLSNSAGSLITVLDAVLVNGFGSATVSMSIHPTDVNKAIITENNHGYSLTTRIRVDGCDNTNFNTEFEIIQIPDANTYVIDVTGLHSQDAGTAVTTSSNITVMIPSLGWTKEFSGTNKAVYRTKGGNRRYLWIDDTETTNGFAKVRGAWGAKGPNFADLISPFPDSVQSSSDPRWHHYISSDYNGSWGTTTDIGWTIVGTDRFFFLSIHSWCGQTNYKGTPSRVTYIFGDVNPYNQTDTSATILSTGDNSTSTFNANNLSALNTFDKWLNGYYYQQSFAGTWFNYKKPTFFRMIPPFADGVNWTANVGVGRGWSLLNPFNDIIPIGAPVLLSDDTANCIRAEMPGMAVSPVYINDMYPQNSLINVNGTRYIVMATKYDFSANTGNEGCFLVQIDGDMHTLKGTA